METGRLRPLVASRRAGRKEASSMSHDVRDRVIKVVAETLKIEPARIDDDSRFVEDLAESMQSVELIAAFEEEFDIEMDEEEPRREDHRQGGRFHRRTSADGRPTGERLTAPGSQSPARFLLPSSSLGTRLTCPAGSQP